MWIFDEMYVLYLESTEKIDTSRKSVFPSVNYLFRKNEPMSFYKDANLGDKTFRKYVKRECAVFDVTGDRVRNSFKCHCVRAASITNLFEAGYCMETIILKSENRQNSSLNSYQNTRGLQVIECF